MTDQITAPAGVVSSTELGTGWAYARYEHAEEWTGGFETREQAAAELLDVFPEGGWVARTRDVTDDDEDAQEGWTFICILESYEHVPPNTEAERQP